MPAFLSPDWIEALTRAADAATGPNLEPDLVVQQLVTRSPAETVSWSVTIGGGRVRVQAGLAHHPTVTFSQDAETAAAVVRGELSAQAAFMTGRLQVSGDVQVLLDHQQVLTGLDDMFAAVRAETTF